MLHLTNAQADELARAIEAAVPFLHELAAHHAHRADAMDYIGERRLTAYHGDRREHTRLVGGRLAEVSAQLRARSVPKVTGTRYTPPPVSIPNLDD